MGNKDSRVTVDICTTQLPRGSTEDMLTAELRAAREILASREATDGAKGAITVPEQYHSPRLAKLSTDQLRSHIERLRNDIWTVQDGWTSEKSFVGESE